MFLRRVCVCLRSIEVLCFALERFSGFVLAGFIAFGFCLAAERGETISVLYLGSYDSSVLSSVIR